MIPLSAITANLRERGQELLKQDLVRKFVPTLVVRGFGALAGISVMLVVARAVTPTDAGLFFIAFMLVQSGARIVSLGAPEMTLRVVGVNHPSDWAAVNHNVSGTLWLVGRVGAVVALIFTVAAEPLANHIFHKPELGPMFMWVGLSMLALSLVQVMSYSLQAKHLILTSTFTMNFLGPALFILVVLSLWISGASLDAWLLAIILAASWFFALFVALSIWFRDEQAKPVWNAKLAPAIKASIASMFVVVSMDMAVLWSGYLATSTFLPEEQVALFATALRTAQINSFLLLGVGLIVAPKFAHAFAEKKVGEIDSLCLLSSRIMLACATPVLIGMLMFPGVLMSAFGPEYVAAAPYLQILAIGQFINLMTGTVGEILPMTGHEKDFRNIVLFTGPLSIVMAVGLTYQFGTMGAVCATALSVATQNLLAVYMVRKRLGFNTMNIFRTPQA